MERIDLIDLDLVYLLSGEVSLSSAAQKMRISATAVSQRLLKIERITGHKLIHRPGPMYFTKAGQRVFRLAELLRQEFSAMHTDLAGMHSHTQTLRIMANTSVIIDDLPLVLDRMRQEHPEVHISLPDGTLTETVRAVLMGDVDIGIVMGKQKVTGLHFMPYRKERICIIAPLSHAIAHLPKVDFKTATSYSIIGTSDNTRIATLIEDVARQQAISINYAISVANYEAQANLVATTNIGIAFTFESIAKRFSINFPIKSIPLTNSWAKVELMMCVRDLDNMSPPAKDFAELIRQRFNPL
jgi:DNA-binding transcriptional LysR family regulator